LEKFRPIFAGNAVARSPIVQYAKTSQSEQISASLADIHTESYREALLYPRFIDIPILYFLNFTTSAKNTRAMKYFLDYVASNPNAKIA
jgi:hypothetical protein